MTTFFLQTLILQYHYFCVLRRCTLVYIEYIPTVRAENFCERPTHRRQDRTSSNRVRILNVALLLEVVRSPKTLSQSNPSPRLISLSHKCLSPIRKVEKHRWKCPFKIQ